MEEREENLLLDESCDNGSAESYENGFEEENNEGVHTMHNTSPPHHENHQYHSPQQYHEDTNKFINWISRVVELVNTYGMKKLLQAMLVVALSAILVLSITALANQNIIEKMVAHTTETHIMGSEIREKINPEVMKIMTKMVYEMECDRVCVMEMHNGKENPTLLPFLYCDVTYEETKDRVPYVGDEYINLSLSKYSFPEYLYENTYYIGSVEDLYKIDKKLAMRLESDEMKYVGIVLMKTTVEIGFLMVGYNEQPTLTRPKILADIMNYVQVIGVYLDYNVQIKQQRK